MTYEASAFHGGLSRREMLRFIPESATTILDVGCSHGRFGSVLKEANPNWTVVGVEPDPEAMSNAADHYDEVILGFYPDDLPTQSRFDCVVFNDVLEHVVDPWGMLRQTLAYLNPGGCVVASIPNVRYVMVVRELALRGRWDYGDWGVLDRTHLRFFTRKSIEELFTSNGFGVETLTPINPAKGWKAALLVGSLSDMRFQQFAVVARPLESQR